MVINRCLMIWVLPQIFAQISSLAEKLFLENKINLEDIGGGGCSLFQKFNLNKQKPQKQNSGGTPENYFCASSMLNRCAFILISQSLRFLMNWYLCLKVSLALKLFSNSRFHLKRHILNYFYTRHQRCSSCRQLRGSPPEGSRVQLSRYFRNNLTVTKKIKQKLRIHYY